jgi:hypothetical protein
VHKDKKRSMGKSRDTYVREEEDMLPAVRYTPRPQPMCTWTSLGMDYAWESGHIKGYT